MKKCPFCAEEIQDEAIKCKHCGEMVNAQAQAIGPAAQAQSGTGAGALKTLGMLIMLSGLAVVFYAYAMDTSVEVPVQTVGEFRVGGGRVNNLGLMNDRQNYLIGGLAATITGLLMALLIKGESAPANRQSPAEPQWVEIEVTPQKRAKYATLFGFIFGAIGYVVALLADFKTGQSVFVGVLSVLLGGVIGSASTPSILASEVRNPSGLR